MEVSRRLFWPWDSARECAVSRRDTNMDGRVYSVRRWDQAVFALWCQQKLGRCRITFFHLQG